MIGAASPGHAAPTAQTSTVMRQLDALTGRRARLTAAVATRQAQVDAFAAAVLAGELRIKRDRAAQARVRSRLAALLVAQYKGPSSDPAAFLLGAGSLDELTSRADTLDRISASQAAVIAQLTADARKADAEEARTTALRRKVSTRLTALTATRAQIDQDITARRQLLAQLTAATLAAVHHEQHRRATLETDTGGANDTGWRRGSGSRPELHRRGHLVRPGIRRTANSVGRDLRPQQAHRRQPVAGVRHHGSGHQHRHPSQRDGAGQRPRPVRSRRARSLPARRSA